MRIVVGNVVTECTSWQQAFELLDRQYGDQPDRLIAWGIAIDGQQPWGTCMPAAIWWALCEDAEKFAAYMQIHVDFEAPTYAH